MFKTKTALAVTAFLAASAVQAAPVFWADWTSGTSGTNGSAAGVITTSSDTINVSYAGEIQFIQTSGGINYWTGTPSPYISAAGSSSATSKRRATPSAAWATAWNCSGSCRRRHRAAGTSRPHS